MKSFSRCGPAVKAFYGLLPGLYAAKTLGNPDGNLSGNGEWARGKGPTGIPTITGLTIGTNGAGADGWDPGIPYGADIPDPSAINGAQLFLIQYSGGTGKLTITINTPPVPQNFFNSIAFGAPVSRTFLTALANSYDGAGTWQWIDPAPGPFGAHIGATCSVTIT